MASILIGGLAFVSAVINLLILLSIYSLGHGKERGNEYYFVLNMALLNSFMAGVVIYGIFA